MWSETLSLCFQIFLAQTRIFATKANSFHFPVESTGTERDEKSNKVDFFYRLGTQTGMVLQGTQDDSSFVAHFVMGEVLNHGLFRSVKYRITGFAK